MTPRKSRRRLGALLAAVTLLAGGALLAGFAAGCTTTVKPLAAYAPQEVPGTFSHHQLDAVLAVHVDAVGRVDYRGLLARPEMLERYYAQVAAFSPDNHPELFPDADARLAYWINAYNGVTIRNVLSLYPIEGPKAVPPPFYLFFLPDGAGFFYLRRFVFGQETTNLYDLERDVIAERFHGEPRIHFALNCASVGCPRLPASAFRPESLQEELEREARLFFSEERNLTIDHGAGQVVLSQILEWYEDDFLDWLQVNRPDERPTLIEYAACYAPEEAARELRSRARGYEVTFRPYDWSLNDQAQAGD